MTSPDGLTDMFGQLRPHILKHADVELLAPFLQKQGTINDTQCKTLKQLAKQNLDKGAIERLLSFLLERGPESIAEFVEALKSSVKEDRLASTYGHRKLLEIIDRERSSIFRDSRPPGEPELPLRDAHISVAYKSSSQLKNSMNMRMEFGQAVRIKNKVYFGGGLGCGPEVHVYDPVTEKFDTLPPTSVQGFAMALYQQQLVLVGGIDVATKKPTGNIAIWDENKQSWSHSLLPMPTPRKYAAAVGYGAFLITAGGSSQTTATNVVEIYNGSSKQWFTAQSLPQACQLMRSFEHSHHWFLTGGEEQKTSVYYTSLDSLVNDDDPTKTSKHEVWKKIPTNTPLKSSSIAVVKNRLLAIGGWALESAIAGSSAIYGYFPSSQTWKEIGDMTYACSASCSIVLSNGELLVFSGNSSIIQKVLFRDNSFDERKFVINNNEKAKDFDWREHGIILHVPEKAFSTTTSECTIDVKSSPTGAYDFPEDAEPVPVTNVYDINTSETLCKPITVVIDHCVAIDPDDDEDLAQLENIRIVVADSSTPQSSYQFRYIESNYTVTPTSVMVSMPHFCFLAAVFSQGHSRTRFCAKIFLQSESLTSHYIHFVLIRNLASYIQMVKEEYSIIPNTRELPSAVAGLADIRFAGEVISLDVPRGGVTTKEGWSIFPTTSTTITKGTAKNYKPGKIFPACQLRMEWMKKERAALLHYPVAMRGALPSDSSFVICIEGQGACISVNPPCNGENHEGTSNISTPSLQSCLTNSSDSCDLDGATKNEDCLELKEEDLGFLMDILMDVAPRWENLGIYLGLKNSQIQCIRRHPITATEGVQGYFRELLAEWLKRGPPYPNDEQLASALTKVGESRLAIKLRVQLQKRKAVNTDSGIASPTSSTGPPASVKRRASMIAVCVTGEELKQRSSRVATGNVRRLSESFNGTGSQKDELRERYRRGMQDEPLFYDLTNEVAARTPNKWRKVGIELGVKEYDLDSLDSQSLGDPIRCFIGVFSMWKNGRTTKEFKWNTITEVLEAPGVGERKLAMDLKLRLPHFKPTVTTITQEFIKEEN